MKAKVFSVVLVFLSYNTNNAFASFFDRSGLRAWAAFSFCKISYFGHLQDTCAFILKYI